MYIFRTVFHHPVDDVHNPAHDRFDGLICRFTLRQLFTVVLIEYAVYRRVLVAACVDVPCRDPLEYIVKPSVSEFVADILLRIAGGMAYRADAGEFCELVGACEAG